MYAPFKRQVIQIVFVFKWTCHNRLCDDRNIHYRLSYGELQVGYLHVESSQVRFNRMLGSI